jgi:serine/threonine-protein kinase
MRPKINAPISRTSRVGERLGNLQLTRLIAEGGMGAVYEAEHVIVPWRFAVKLLHPEFARNQRTYERFRQEALISSVLDSAHVVPVKEFGILDDGTPYLVMDYLEGEDLRAILEREAPLSLDRAVNLIHQACLGLRVAHEHVPAIVHRDLKPENLFVCERGSSRELLKILDFGIAKYLEEPPSRSFHSTVGVIGTPYYMSPEQAEGSQSVDQRADIYSMGAVLYECLSGVKAHPGETYNEIIAHILLKRPTPIGQLRSDIPVALCEIVELAMAYDVDRRFQSAAEFSEALLHSLPIPSGGRTLNSESYPVQDRSYPPDAITLTFDATEFTSHANSNNYADEEAPPSTVRRGKRRTCVSTSKGVIALRWYAFAFFAFATLIGVNYRLGSELLLGVSTDRSSHEVVRVMKATPKALLPTCSTAQATTRIFSTSPAAPIETGVPSTLPRQSLNSTAKQARAKATLLSGEMKKQGTDQKSVGARANGE